MYVVLLRQCSSDKIGNLGDSNIVTLGENDTSIYRNRMFQSNWSGYMISSDYIRNHQLFLSMIYPQILLFKAILLRWVFSKNPNHILLFEPNSRTLSIVDSFLTVKWASYILPGVSSIYSSNPHLSIKNFHSRNQVLKSKLFNLQYNFMRFSPNMHQTYFEWRAIGILCMWHNLEFFILQISVIWLAYI